MTQDFLESGSTENQRIYRAGAKKPKTGSRVDFAADRYAEQFMRNNPEIGDILRPPPAAVDLSDLSRSELLKVYEHAWGGADLPPEEARALSEAVRSLRSG